MKKLWFYPLFFGIIGALLGLILRYAFTGEVDDFNFKFITHAHSHVMLLGFIFNALLLLVWKNFCSSISRIDKVIFLIMQACIGLFTLAFIFQGYAFYSILFSSLHLWLSYVLMVRIWRKLRYSDSNTLLIKWGIVFHFISSLGPYALGPLMVLKMKDSPWYGQAIFFYLHFQYFGIYFLWMLALIFKQVKVTLSKKEVLLLVISLAVLFVHSLQYNFNNLFLNVFGVASSITLVWLLAKQLLHFKKLSKLQFIYGGILGVAILTVIGSFPAVNQWFIDSQFLLIAWLHLLFLGIYTPFIWLKQGLLNNKYAFIIYLLLFGLSEWVMIFPNYIAHVFSVSIMYLLFWLYVAIFILISGIHLKGIFNSTKEKILQK